ncbi:MAG: ATP-dependent Clp protease, ATP-binding subunit ClpC, partial [uncultured Blastococcus sp.]
VRTVHHRGPADRRRRPGRGPPAARRPHRHGAPAPGPAGPADREHRRPQPARGHARLGRGRRRQLPGRRPGRRRPHQPRDRPGGRTGTGRGSLRPGRTGRRRATGPVSGRPHPLQPTGQEGAGAVAARGHGAEVEDHPGRSHRVGHPPRGPGLGDEGAHRPGHRRRRAAPGTDHVARGL